ncbi:hypothetical protein V2L07_07510 [Pseudomonas alliivorans]|nr:hypothetical protein [Pseudomonas alliivorans]MEE4572628.1 hypothetical protein [Pseudomonas alliivorans]MEE5086420.1 hypothetical protein [Pseudomonas alliivorans]
MIEYLASTANQRPCTIKKREHDKQRTRSIVRTRLKAPLFFINRNELLHTLTGTAIHPIPEPMKKQCATLPPNRRMRFNVR